MKKLLLILSCVFVLIGCNGHYENLNQTGVVVDVEYHPAHTTIQVVPIRVGKVTTTQTRPVHHSEYWRAHVHYCDTICVYQKFSHEVHKGDIVSRNVRVFIKDKE